LRDYNELQSDSNTINDNNANAKNKNLKTIIGKKPAELDSSGYSAKMIVNRAKAMSCSGFYQDSNGAEITLNVNQLKSQSFHLLYLSLIEVHCSDHAKNQPLKPLTNLNLDSLHQQKDHPMNWI
jgi:hypothetical protein